MQIKRYLAENTPEADVLVDEKAREYMASHENTDYLTAVREVLRDDIDLARQYYKRPAPVEPDDSQCKTAHNYTQAMASLTAEAQDFADMHKLPFDLAFKRTICRPENRLLTRMYLEGAPSLQGGDD